MAKEDSKTELILTTQEVEGKSGVLLASVASPMDVSVYYNTAKGWDFNDVVYVDSCLKYDSAYGGPSTGVLEAGYYRFVKTNGSYVALCEVNLVADTIARNSYVELWNKYGGIWSWEQAFFNQLDGTAELSNPWDVKTVKLENGKVVIDETQNFRFIKCWIKIEDLQPNPETLVKSYTQTIRLFIYNERTGKSLEKMNLKVETIVENGKEYTPTINLMQGYWVKDITFNGESKGNKGFSYIVSQDNEICVYYTPYKLTIMYQPNGGSGSVKEQVFYYGETITLSDNYFLRNNGVFLGWGKIADSGEVDYVGGEIIENTLKQSDQVMVLYAIWDLAPNVKLPELYFTKEQLLNKEDINGYILSFCRIVDEEDGEVLIPEEGSVVFLTDLRDEIEKITEGWVTYKVDVTDSSGNQIVKSGRIYIVNPKAIRTGMDRDDLRFIEMEYLHTLEGDSVWRKDRRLRILLIQCLEREIGVVWKKTEFGWQRVG